MYTRNTNGDIIEYNTKHSDSLTEESSEMSSDLNIYNVTGDVNDDNTVYNAFNSFIFSDDRKVFHKLLMRNTFMSMTFNTLGDIVECGVFKGSGIVTWSKLLELYSPFEIKKVVGFDFFNPSFVNDISNANDKKLMKQVFQRSENTDIDTDDKVITKKLLDIGIKRNKFELVKGDISITSKEYVQKNPGFRISLLYMDLDLEKPTLDTLENFWPIISKGGVIVFDEYGYGAWTESNAVDTFVNKHGLKLHKTSVAAPTAYVIK